MDIAIKRIQNIIFLIIFLFFLSGEEIINNPVKMNDFSNPMIIKKNSKYYIFTSGQVILFNNENRIIEASSSFNEYNIPYVLCLDESNNYGIYIKNLKKYFNLTNLPIYSYYSFPSSMDFPTSTNYVGYMKESEFNGGCSLYDCRCKIYKNEIIIYGKSSLYITFSFILNQASDKILINFNMDDQISCKLLLNAEYICAFIYSKKVYLYTFAYVIKTQILSNKCELMKIGNIEVNIMNTHTKVTLYDTTENQIKILCAKNINNNKIECIYVSCDVEEKIGLLSLKIEYTSKFTIGTKIILSFPLESTNNEDCIFTKFGSEYIFCCGGNNLIKCARLKNDYSLINTFILDIPGDNTKLSIVSESSHIEIFYMNNLSSQKKTYEYYISYPECQNKEYAIIVYHSINEDKIGTEESINNLFVRKTNTQYYIEFENIPSDYGDFTINGELINQNNIKFMVENENPYIYDFISTNDEIVDKFEILYTISIQETYSSQCKIELTILPCYDSCNRCSKDKSSSNSEDHNCLENNCKEDYYIDPTKNTNCFKISEKKDNWYFDIEENKFGLCHESCAKCDGPLNNECLACYSPEINSNYAYLYNNQCSSSCPEGTYPKKQSDGYYKCLPCYKNCKTCSQDGDSSNMNCDTCKENNIHFRQNCFEEYDSNSKSFYLPENNEISSCYELYGYYIEENTYECIYKDNLEGFFLLNPTTGLISPCHSDCKTCSENYTESNSNCDSCKDENMNFFDGNCISSCPEGYYSLEKSSSNDKKQCKKCHDNCVTCNSGPLYNNLNILTNMKCINCKKDVDPNDPNKFIEKYIQGNGNCFPIITYTEEKIIFDASEINPGESEKTCLDYGKSIFYGDYQCSTKPSNTFYVLNNEENTGVVEYCDRACSTCNGEKNSFTQDTNCIECSDGYFKTEDSNTNCILENLIQENYFKNANDNIYYRCYINCKKCSNFFDTENNNMNCDECIENYYFIYNTNNCYNMDFIQDNNNYYFSSDDNKFHKCYSSCSKCNVGGTYNNHNCEECINNYYFEDNTKNCYNISYVDNGYYLDNYTLSDGELPKFKKCYENCSTCYNYLIDDEMNCNLCKANYYKINGTNNCYKDDILSKGYYLKNNLFFSCEENCLTCSNGKTILNEIESNNCLSCDKINKGLYLVNELNNCEPINYTNNGYYLKEDPNGIEIFYKCYETCSLCDNGKEDENHNCLTCADNYYPKRNDIYPKNCYGNEMISLGYNLVKNFWQICHENCLTCAQKPLYDEYNELISQNCITCIEGFNLVYQTSNCANESIIEEGYYLSDDDSMYHKCDIQCQTCEKNSNEYNPKCLSCNIQNGYYPSDDKPISHCYNKTTIGKGHSLYQTYDEDTGIITKKWILCYSTCQTCFAIGDEVENNCLSCISKHYLIYNTTNCILNEYAISNGYYFNTIYGQYVKCDKACINCHDGLVDGNTNCIKCNENEGYYSIKGKSNSMCFNSESIGEGYFLDKFDIPYKWSECFEKCASCEIKGNARKMFCNSCKTNLISKTYNKVIYLKLSNGNCLEGCPNNLFLTKEGDCVELCPSKTFQFIPNTTCVDFCPPNYELDENKTKCVASTSFETMTSSYFKEIISNNISSFVDSTKVINGSDFKAQIIQSSDLDPKEQIKNGISGLDLGDCIEVLKKAYNIPKEKDLIIVEIESKEDKGKNTNLNKKEDYVDIGKDVQVGIYDFSGRKLDMSVCNQDIIVMKGISDIEDIDLGTAMKLADQGIDVFNAKDSFFNDICHPFQNDKDLVLGDRREDLFQNVSFCGDKCLYNGMDYQLMIAKCSCDPSTIQSSDGSSGVDENNKKGVNLNDLANSFTSELFTFNFVIIKCYNLVFNGGILRRNIGFIIMISMNGLQILFLFLFSLKCLKPIKNYMLVFEPYDPNVDPPNPPPKSRKLSLSKNLGSENHSKLYDLIDINFEENKNKNKKDKEIQKTILINNLISNKNSPKKEIKLTNKMENNNNIYTSKRNDDALVIHYLDKEENSSSNSSSISSDENNRKDNNIKKTDSVKKETNIIDNNINKSESELEENIQNKNDSKNSHINKIKINKEKLFSHIKIKGVKFIEKKEDKEKISLNQIPNRNSNNLEIFNRNAKNKLSIDKDKEKEAQSKQGSTLISSIFSPNRRETTTISDFDNLSPTVHVRGRNNSISTSKKYKFNSPDIRRKDIIIEKKEEDEENYEQSEDIKKSNENNLSNFNDINNSINNSFKRKRIFKNKTIKYKFAHKNSTNLKSTDVLMSEENNENNVRNYISLKKRKQINRRKEKEQTKKFRDTQKEFRRYSKKNKNSSKSVAITNNVKNTEENKKTESELNKSTNNNKENSNNKPKVLGNMRLRNKKVSSAYTDDELQDMEFEEALHNDNRSFFRMYLFYLIEEHVIINAFFSEGYLDLRLFKFSFLIFSFEISFFLNALFYTDEYISDTYHNDGVLDFVSSLPKSIYSFIVTLIISNLLKMLSSSKKQFLKIIRERTNKRDYLEAVNIELKKLRKKLIIYFIFIFVLGIFFLYYVTAFCAVYNNSQYYWFYGCLESLGMDMVTPFSICIIFTLLRYFALIRHNSCMYSTADILSSFI